METLTEMQTTNQQSWNVDPQDYYKRRPIQFLAVKHACIQIYCLKKRYLINFRHTDGSE